MCYKVNLAFGFVLNDIEDGMCRFFYTHKNNTIMERSQLVCTQADMTNLKDRTQKMDIVEFLNPRRNLYKMEISQTYKFNRNL